MTSLTAYGRTGVQPRAPRLSRQQLQSRGCASFPTQQGSSQLRPQQLQFQGAAVDSNLACPWPRQDLPQQQASSKSLWSRVLCGMGAQHEVRTRPPSCSAELPYMSTTSPGDRQDLGV